MLGSVACRFVAHCSDTPGDTNGKVMERRGIPDIFALKGSPVLVFFHHA
jgi:hypothetical protein